MNSISVKIGEKTREISTDDVLTLCGRKNIKILTDTFSGRVSFQGNEYDSGRLRAVIRASPELEVALILELSKDNSALQDTLVERMCLAELKGTEAAANFIVRKQAPPHDEFSV